MSVYTGPLLAAPASKEQLNYADKGLGGNMYILEETAVSKE